MVSLNVVLWIFVVLFAIIGGIRGWAKEILVIASVIVSLTLLKLLESNVPFVEELVAKTTTIPSPEDTQTWSSLKTLFWLRTIIMLGLVFFGYQTPNIARFAPKMAREKLQDMLLGALLGALNGFLIVGSLWYYLHDSHYPFTVIIRPDPTPAIIAYLAPRWLGPPHIYFAVVVAFIFVLIVFI